MNPRRTSALVLCVVLTAQTSAHAGVSAEETTVIDFLQMFTIDSRVNASIEGEKAHLELAVRMNSARSNAAAGEETHSVEIHRLDRGVVYRLNPSSRQYREIRFGSPVPGSDTPRQIAAIASALKCQWKKADVAKTDVGREIVRGASTSHVRIDASRRCTPVDRAGASCTFGITYDEWRAKRDGLLAQFASYRHEYAVKAGTGSGITEGFMVFSQFGVPVDPVLVETIRKAAASEGQALKTSAVLRASRSCFAWSDDAGDAAAPASVQPADSRPTFLPQYVGALLLHAWVAEERANSETLGSITTELESIRAQNFDASLFELPAGFARVP